MKDDIKKIASGACRSMLRPVVKVMLRCGMTYRECAEHLKAVYVDAASEEYGLRDRPTNISRVSILTGIARREVKRVRELVLAADLAENDRITWAGRVLSGWHQDADFIDADGQPLELSETGPAPSYEALFARYGGDIPQSALLKELMAVGSVKRLGDGRLRAAKRYYMPEHTDLGLIARAGSVVEDLGAVLYFNIAAQPGEQGRFEGRASSTQIPRSAVPEYREFLETNAEAFLELIDDWLAENEIDDPQQECVRLGVGVYTIEGDARHPADAKAVPPTSEPGGKER